MLISTAPVTAGMTGCKVMLCCQLIGKHSEENKEVLENILFDIAINQEVILSKQDQYGTQYDIKFLITTEVGTFLVISCWILRTDEDFPRLTNAYPVNK